MNTDKDIETSKSAWIKSNFEIFYQYINMTLSFTVHFLT